MHLFISLENIDQERTEQKQQENGNAQQQDKITTLTLSNVNHNNRRSRKHEQPTTLTQNDNNNYQKYRTITTTTTVIYQVLIRSQFTMSAVVNTTSYQNGRYFSLYSTVLVTGEGFLRLRGRRRELNIELAFVLKNGFLKLVCHCCYCLSIDFLHARGF